MHPLTDYQFIFDTTYKKVFVALKRSYENFKAANADWTVQKKWNQFLLEITFVRDYELLCWKEPHQVQVSNFKILKNPFKIELKEIFEFKEVTYTEDFINNFVKQDIPKLRKEHLQKFQSGHRDYQWDNEFIQSATDEDVINLLAKYYAYSDFIEKKHPDYEKNHAQKQRVVLDDKVQAAVKWTSDPDEFVMLFSMLYDTGTIEDVQNVGKIKMLEKLATYFDIELAEGWQNNIETPTAETPEFIKKMMEKYNRKVQR